MTDSAYALRRDLISMLPADCWAELVAGLGAVDLLARLVDLGVFASDDWPWVLDEGLLTPLLHAVLVRAGRLDRVHLWQWGRLGALATPAMDAGRTPGVILPLPPSGYGLALAAGMSQVQGRALCLTGRSALKTRAFTRMLLRGRPTQNLCLIVLCDGEQGCKEALDICEGRELTDRDLEHWSIASGVWVYPCRADLKGGRTLLTQSVKESLLERLRLAAGKEAVRPWDMNFSFLSGDL